MPAAVVIERGETGEARGLLAREAAEFAGAVLRFGHQHDEAQGGLEAKARDREQQVETLGQIGLGPHRHDEVIELLLGPVGGAAGIGFELAAQARVGLVLQAQLGPARILDRLLDEDEAIGQRLQARIGGGALGLPLGNERRECGDQGGVVLRVPQDEADRSWPNATAS
ncbi:hypothetical protein [Methylobacterium gnaphalii]|uniref:hypothetical protein n=2 Tax=Methylobacterium gnaphalii TaxID=1010610 RepID=UPI001EE2B0DE|nr:hypothetical protein [Methylobacterium gnaphalii]